MKHIYSVASAALLIFFSASCQTQEPEIAQQQPEPEIETPVSAPITFTCTFDENKTTLDSENSPIWQEGDFIIVYNGDKANSASKQNQTTFQVVEDSDPVFYLSVDGAKEPLTNNIVEKIDITSDMISNGGKTVEFTTTKVDPAQTCYYAVAESKGSHLVYSMNTSGQLTFREASYHTDLGVEDSPNLVYAAVATCPAGQNSFSFKNVLCQLKFTVTPGKYNYVDVSANSGSTNTFKCGVSGLKFDLSSLGTAANKADPYKLTLNNKGSGGPYYIPVPPCVKLDKGITIKCYRTSTDSNPYTLTIGNELKLERNTIIDLGDLDQVRINSYYERWQDGSDIIINGVRYNKKDYGEGILYDTDVELPAAIKGVVFVKEGVTVTMSANIKPSASLIVMCDQPGKSANMVIGNAAIVPQKSNVTYIFKSMNISTTKNSFLYGSATNTVAKLGFYDCNLDINANYYSLTATVCILNVDYIGCNIKTRVGDIGIFDGTKNGGNKIGSIIFNNNIVYSEGSNRSFRILRQGRTNITDAVGVVEIKNNTFYNIIFTSGLCTPASVDEFYLENNLFAYSAKFDSYQRCLHLATDDTSSKQPPVSGYPSAGKVVGNGSYNASGRVLGVFNPSERIGDKSWYSTNYKEISNLTENPFSTEDAANGIFTQKTSFASYGATR